MQPQVRSQPPDNLGKTSSVCLGMEVPPDTRDRAGCSGASVWPHQVSGLFLGHHHPTNTSAQESPERMWALRDTPAGEIAHSYCANAAVHKGPATPPDLEKGT